MKRFVDDLQEALSCVTAERLSVAKFHPSAEPHTIWLGDEAEIVPLRGSFRLGLAVVLAYHVVGAEDGWKVRTGKYIYEITDALGNSLFEFHWHPDGSSRVNSPHMHIRPSLKVAEEVQALYRAVTKAHIPTGRVALEEVLRFLVTELGVEPLREDWDALLH